MVRETHDEPQLVKRCTIAILADDLTGANDTGAQFSRLGGAVLVLASLPYLPPRMESAWDAVVLNTASRNLSPGEARVRVRDACAYVRRLGIPLVYKKIDSTLRGNLIPELEELLSQGPSQAIIAPAFPLNGRTVEHGVLKVGGVPVQDTEASRDSLSPVATGNIPDLLAPVYPRAVGAIGLDVIELGSAAVKQSIAALERDGRRLIVCDAKTQADLAHLAEALKPYSAGRVLVGSAGLARELAKILLSESIGPVPAAGCDRVLVVAGSRSAVTARQVDRLREWGVTAETVLLPGAVDGIWSAGRAGSLAADACDALQKRHRESAGAEPVTFLVTIGANGDMATPEQCHTRSRRLNETVGAAIAEAERRWPGTGLVLTGGDVAEAVIAALDAEGIELGGEVMPGVPIGRLFRGKSSGTYVITKAGAFGGEDALVFATKALQGT